MKLIILLLTAFTVSAQIARPTINPFNTGMMQQQGNFNQQWQNNFAFPNNTNHPLNFNRPTNNGFQNNGFNNGFQNNGFQNHGFQNNGFQNNGYGFNNGFQNNGFNNPQQQNNNWQQQQPQQTNNIPLFTRRFHLNNGYLYGRPTLWYDPKSNKMQPWVRKNLR